MHVYVTVTAQYTLTRIEFHYIEVQDKMHSMAGTAACQAKVLDIFIVYLAKSGPEIKYFSHIITCIYTMVTIECSFLPVLQSGQMKESISTTVHIYIENDQ